MARRVLDAIGWLLAQMWSWPVTGVMTPLIYGAGLAALFGDEYVIASVLCCLAVLWVTLKTVFWEETADQEHRIFVQSTIGIVGLLFCVLSVWWIQHRRWHEIEASIHVSKPSTPKEPSPVPIQPPTSMVPSTALSLPTRAPIKKPNSIPPAKSPEELTPIILSAKVYDPQSPSIVVSNKSNRVAQGITWELVVFRTSDSSYFSFRTQEIGYVKPNSNSAPYSMNLENIIGETDGGQMKEGDHFVGGLLVDCPECQGVTYIISLDWKQGGWTSNAPSSFNGKLLLPKDMSPEGRAKFTSLLEALAPVEKREPISHR